MMPSAIITDSTSGRVMNDQERSSFMESLKIDVFRPAGLNVFDDAPKLDPAFVK